MPKRLLIKGLCVLMGCFSVASFALPTPVQTALRNANLPESALRAVVVPLPSKVRSERPAQLSHFADTPSTPASTQKLITTAIALDVLGADFKWQTGVSYTGVLTGGVLYGDLILTGAGEPSLTHERLTALLGAIGEKITHIDGNIMIDNSRFVNVGYDPNAFDGQGERAYNAEPSAFLVNFGTVELKFTPSGQFLYDVDGEPTFYPNPEATTASVSLLPALSDVVIEREIATQNNCQLPKMQLKEVNKAGKEMVLIGRFGANCGTQSLWRNFGDNDDLAVRAVSHFWHKHDLNFRGEVKIGTPTKSALPLLGLPVLVTHSKPLSEQIHQINHFSNNVMTEQLALSLPLYAKGEKWSDYPKAFLFLDEWWRSHLTSAPPVITRASGLCTDCAIAPTAMAELLQYMYRHQAFVPFFKSLPVAGQSGTMKNLANRSPNNLAIGRAWIKTGTLKNVTSMAGYVKGHSGQDYAVVAFINADGAGYQSKSVAVLDELIGWVAGH